MYVTRKSLEECVALMESLTGSLERYASLAEDLCKSQVPIVSLQSFVTKREEILRQIDRDIEALKYFEETLNTNQEANLRNLKERIRDYRQRCEALDTRLIERLERRQNLLKNELKSLHNAGRAMRGYGKRSPLPPRFLDNES